MTAWAEVEASDSRFAGQVRAIFDARRHKTLATLRQDGSPRLSGIEVQFGDGEVTMGMMPDSLKAKDLQRDPRLTVHASSDDPPEDNQSLWKGDAKISGRAVQARKPAGGSDEVPATWFRIDISEVVLTHLDPAAENLLVDSWHPGRGLEHHKRQ
jgi:Pyridoxamine 5'-phosphate oxidase